MRIFKHLNKTVGLGAALVALSLVCAGCGNDVHYEAKPSLSHSVMRPANYQKPSEKKPYPSKVNKNDRIVVSEEKQRAYLQAPQANGPYKNLYTFYVSTGKNVRGRRTPKGTYHTNVYKSKWFYSPQEHEGARYATGFHDGGLYLFHETPSNQKGQIIKPVAKELGKKGTSYGCVHMTVPDVKWFYSHVPAGIRVIIN